ncbi:MAG: SIP domain-containing protein [Actinomycetota bacterium]
MTEAAFSTEELEQLEVMLDMANGQLSDSIAMLARWAEDDGAIAAATLTAVDHAGLTMTIPDGGDGHRPLRLDFPAPMTSLHDLPTSMGSLLAVARKARPQEPRTSMEELLDHDHDELRLSFCTVTDVEVLSPQLRAIGVSGLDGVTSHGGDQSVALIIDRPDRPIPDGLDAKTYWEMDDKTQPKGSTYSVRSIDPETGTATFWVVTHGDDPETISGWATTAVPGDRVGVLGPHEGISTVGDVASFIGVCDETAFAAVAATVDELPPELPVHIIAEVEQPGHEVPLTDRPGVEVTWSYRSEADADAPYALATAVRDRIVRADDGLFVMGAGESRCLTAVRTYLRQELGLAAGQVSLIPYWRQANP